MPRPRSSSAPVEIPPHAYEQDRLRYRIYARKAGQLRELGTCATPADLGAALVQMHQDGKRDADGTEHPEYRLYDEGAIGVLDGETSEWIILPWQRRGTS